MVSLLGLGHSCDRVADVLEPGAGAGALAEAVLDAVAAPPILTLVERDVTLGAHLRDFVDDHATALNESSTVLIDDFLALAPKWVREGRRFSHIVMNPPYGRVSANSPTANLLRREKVRAHNLFAAFIWLAADLLADDGRLVAVVPRSFLSGLQYAATREHLFREAHLFALHHFSDRRAVFQRDAVQQEVVVFGVIRASASPEIQFSQSKSLVDRGQGALVPASRLVLGATDKHVILVPSLNGGEIAPDLSTEPLLPADVTVAVGSVVDFRAGDDLVSRSESDVPLIGAEAFYSKPHSLRGLRFNDRTARHVYPPGRYVVVRRISPAEATPRVQVRLIDATGDEFLLGVAFENHVLVLHQRNAGLSMRTCTLLLERLSNDLTEQQFAERGGTTQVNVSDIRALRYAN